MKIYNEIIIDMNPESSTFEETLHEDSFEYNGDMIFAQEDMSLISDPYKSFYEEGGAPKEGQIAFTEHQGYDPSEGNYEVWQFSGGQWQRYNVDGEDVYATNNPQGQSWPGAIHIDSLYNQHGEENILKFGSESAFETFQQQTTKIGGQEDFGMPSLSYEDYKGKSTSEMVDYLFTTKYNDAVPTTYKPDDTPEARVSAFKAELAQKLTKVAPQLGGVDPTKMGFLAEQYGGPTGIEDDPSTPDIDESQISFKESLIGEKAGEKMSQDIYQLSQKAHEFAPAVSTATGMGSSLRAGIAGQQVIGTGFEKATDEYGLAERGADFGYRGKFYGLEQEKVRDWEKNFLAFVNQLPDPGTGQ